MRLVFVHGWGFDAQFWRPLQAALGMEGQCLDLGYHGPPHLDISKPKDPFVAIGHSFGVQWLLHACSDLPMQALVSINGFARFVKGDGFDVGVHPRVLKRMIDGFARQPEAVYRDFLKLCGDTAPRTGSLNLDRLLEDLNALNDWDTRNNLKTLKAPVLALAGGLDQVVPQAMSEAAFAPETLAIKADANHLLPLSAPEWCAERITAFLGERGL